MSEKAEWAFPKIQAMLDAIDEMAPDEKGVIFSQWTYVLMCFPLIYTRTYRTGPHGLYRSIYSSYLNIIQDEMRQRLHVHADRWHHECRRPY
jgi:hypothetical protein